MHVLEQMWGNEMPPAQDPVQAVMIDAVASDDEQGRDDGLVVQGDGLSLDVLQQLLRAAGSAQERLLLLPPNLTQRLVGRIMNTSTLPIQEFKTGI